MAPRRSTCPCPSRFQQWPEPVPVLHPTRAGDGHGLVGRDQPQVQGDGRRCQLPGGAGRIEALHRPIEEGLGRVRAQGLPLGRAAIPPTKSLGSKVGEE